MPPIDDYCDPLDPIPSSALCSEVFTRFDAEPNSLVLAVVDDGRPVGLVERDAFLRELAAPGGRTAHADQPITVLMDQEPVVLDGALEADSLTGAASHRGSSQDALRGFIVTREGRYCGVGTLLKLLQIERARAEQAAPKARFDFLSLLSRELRTSLNGVAAVANLLRRQPLNADAQAYVQTIMDSSESTLRTLEDAVDLARAEAGELQLDPQPVLLRQLMDDLDTVWGPRAIQDGVSLMIGYEGDTELAANLDAGRLRQVFNHLIGNALKFARNGVVEASLSARVEGDTVAIRARVRDNGPGISPDRIPGLFAIAGAADGAKVGGLGLPICHLVVQTMGGAITAEPNAGQGVTFAFKLTPPLAHVDVEEGKAGTVAHLDDLHLAAHPHVLIVDDNGTNRVVAQALCEMFGCTSDHAEDGVEALEAVKTSRYDLILMDIKMPRMDGVEATQAIRALPGEVSQTPIIALTANADPEDAKRYLSCGMQAVVEKPIKPERLLQVITTALTGEAPAEDALRAQRVA